MEFLLLGIPLVPVLAAPCAAASRRGAWAVADLGVGYRLRADGLGVLFALLVAGVGVLIVLYARSYLHHEPRTSTFFAYLCLFTGAMLGIVLADDLLTLYVFWEGTSLASRSGRPSRVHSTDRRLPRFHLPAALCKRPARVLVPILGFACILAPRVNPAPRFDGGSARG
jgi:hypothetical protein